MGIGGSIFLIALGAILAFAVNFNMGWLDINIVGWVLILAGVTGLTLTLAFWNRRRTAVVTTQQSVQDPAAQPAVYTERPTYTERRVYSEQDPPPPPA